MFPTRGSKIENYVSTWWRYLIGMCVINLRYILSLQQLKTKTTIEKRSSSKVARHKNETKIPYSNRNLLLMIEHVNVVPIYDDSCSQRRSWSRHNRRNIGNTAADKRGASTHHSSAVFWNRSRVSKRCHQHATYKVNSWSLSMSLSQTRRGSGIAVSTYDDVLRKWSFSFS